MIDMDSLIELRKEVIQDKVLEDGYLIMTKEARKKLTEIDKEIHRLKESGERLLTDIDKVAKKIEDINADLYSAVIENMKSEIDEKIGKRIDGLEEYLQTIVFVLEKILDR